MNERKTITSLSELPQSIEPPRDLWPQIQAQLNASSHPKKPTRAYLMGIAATVAALAVGIWLGRSTLPMPGSQRAASTDVNNEAAMVRAAYVTDPRYVNERAALVQSLEARLRDLPPDSRTKVLASLETIRNSMHDIEVALGRDPSNALLQEMLLNTHQDEMRVLAAVQEASDTGEEI